MNIVLSFEDTVSSIEVALPEDSLIFDFVSRAKQAIAEGKRQIVKLDFESDVSGMFPRQGFIELDYMDDEDQSVNFEGPWSLYERRPIFHASRAKLSVVCEVVHLLLTIKP